MTIVGRRNRNAPTPEEAKIIDAFKERRAESWRQSRFSLIIVAFGIAYLGFACGSVFASISCGVVTAIVAATAFHASYVSGKLYRCPACEELVTNESNSLRWN